VVGGSLEVITRGTFILRQIAVSDDAAAAAAAQDALQRLASSQTTAVARRAKSTLRAVGGLLQDRSMRQLEHLGAQVFRADQRVLLRIAPNLFTVRIGRQWRGGREGLTHLSRLIDVQQVVLEGPQVDDRWLQQLKPLRDLRAVTIIGGNITDDGLAHLSHVQNLQYLRLWYVPLTDASIDHLKRHRKLEELELYGTDIAREAVDRLLDHVEEGAIDYRRGGGFLGVGCTLHGDGGCRITSVEPGTAAANAGLRAGDHIVRLGECKQPTFEQLTAEIGYHRPGEKIEVELVRTAGQPSVVKGVTLGAWTIDYRLQ